MTSAMFDSAEAREAFGRIYATDEWTGGSGQGSRVAATQRYRAVLETIVGAVDVRSVVDVGCGDWEFSQLVDWSGVSYLGLDVVPDVIERNRARFGGPRVAFELRDGVNESLPTSDLLICKDVLQHWPIDAIRQFLATTRSAHRYVLLTNDVSSVHCPPERLNSDVPVGGWRTIDLELSPFGVRPAWRLDLDIGGEWTKRMLLLVRARSRPLARGRSGSALRRVRSHVATA
jgi:SAM-dependent methyltransferase